MKESLPPPAVRLVKIKIQGDTLNPVAFLLFYIQAISSLV